MNITNCVKCGGNVRPETIGWICENCNGFIDMDGNYHPHVEKPFMPPMTNGDRIKAMTDEELAMFLDGFDSCPGHYCREACLDWLKQPAKEDEYG